MKSWKTHVRDAAIRAVDHGAERVGDSGEHVIHKLSREWRKLDDEDKQQLAEIVVAVGAAVGALAMKMREKGKKGKATKLARKTGKKALKKVVEKTIAAPLEKMKKK
jgi:creatinine amidohydrolase/Fe(II)-dependent formamide hydrolase-like protein